MAAEHPHLSPAVRELLELWDEQLLSIWLEARLKSEWQSHTLSGVDVVSPGGAAS